MFIAFGGSWFDTSGKRADRHARVEKGDRLPRLTLMKNYGPPGAAANGFNENLTLFAGGKAAMWIDATVAAGTLDDTKESQVVDKARVCEYARLPSRPKDRTGALVVGVCDSTGLEVAGGRGEIRALGHVEGLHQPRRRRYGLG